MFLLITRNKTIETTITVFVIDTISKYLYLKQGKHMFLSLDMRARIVSSSWRKTNRLVLFCMVLPHVTWYDICLIMSWFTFVRQFNILLQINE